MTIFWPILMKFGLGIGFGEKVTHAKNFPDRAITSATTSGLFGCLYWSYDLLLTDLDKISRRTRFRRSS